MQWHATIYYGWSEMWIRMVKRPWRSHENHSCLTTSIETIKSSLSLRVTFQLVLQASRWNDNTRQISWSHSYRLRASIFMKETALQINPASLRWTTEMTWITSFAQESSPLFLGANDTSSTSAFMYTSSSVSESVNKETKTHFAPTFQ